MRLILSCIYFLVQKMASVKIWAVHILQRDTLKIRKVCQPTSIHTLLFSEKATYYLWLTCVILS